MDKALLTAEEREIAERCEKVTPGNWLSQDGDPRRDCVIYVTGNPCIIAEVIAPKILDKKSARPNADFIAHARTDIPALLETVASLRAALAQAQAEPWIAVTERLPEEMESVLIAIPTLNNQNVHEWHYEVGWLEPLSDGEQWFGTEADNYEVECVEAWQPIIAPMPTPPRAGELDKPAAPSRKWSEYMAKHGREEYAQQGALALIDAVFASPEQKFPVIERELGKGLGYIDLGKGEIVIEIRQTNAQKNQILLHEIMHLCAEKMKQGGICKRQPSEEFIKEFSGVVFTVMGASGLLKHVEPTEALQFAAPSEIGRGAVQEEV